MNLCKIDIPNLYYPFFLVFPLFAIMFNTSAISYSSKSKYSLLLPKSISRDFYVDYF